MDGGQTISHPWTAPPDHGAAIEVGPGVLWMRLPLPMALDHVNVYAIDHDGGWVIVDTGVQSSKNQGIWRSLLSGPLAGRPVRAVMFSHHHPDHVGSVAWLARETGAEIWATRTAWLMARMLTLDEQDRPTPEALQFYRQTGMAEAVYQERATSRPFNFCDAVGLLPLGYRRIADGDVLSLGGRDWHVLTGHGHAPEQATLWCAEAGLSLTADQILPGISPNLGVYPTEPEADPVGPWLSSCSRLQEYARTNAPESLLALPGHKLPFQGVDLRLAQLIDNHHQALERLQDFLSTPQVAVACFQCLFKREIKPSEFGLALAETVGHLNHLRATGKAERQLRDDGAYLWRATV